MDHYIKKNGDYIPVGAMVMVSDGTKCPPARHNRKRLAWKQNNYYGKLEEIQEDVEHGEALACIRTMDGERVKLNVWTQAERIELATANNLAIFADDLSEEVVADIAETPQPTPTRLTRDPLDFSSLGAAA